MTRRTQWVASAVAMLSLIVAVISVVVTRNENRHLRGVIRENQRQLILSQRDCEMIASDLASVDSPSLAYWKLLFQRSATGQIAYGQPAIDFQERIDIYHNSYKTRESPARSNHFAALLLSLIQKQHDRGLSVAELTSYLGLPDGKSNSVTGDVLWYAFTANGKDAAGIFEVSSQVVSKCSVDSITR